jgi:type II secretory pathway component GspD/PulD (secretin)
MKTFHVQYIEAKQLKETLSSLLSEGDTVSVHEASNSVVVRTAAANLDRVARVIAELDAPPKQVLIEAKIIELNAGDEANLGLDVKGIDANNTNNFAMTKGLAGRSTDTNPVGLYAQVITSNAEAYLSALETRDDFDLISSPQITTVNHKEASLLIGAKYGYSTSTTTQTVTVQEINYLEVGTKLIITPHISDDGYILMDLKPTLSDGKVLNNLPQETTTETENRVLVKDGQTIILAGLIRSRDETKDTGVPYLMSIPILGGFFRKTETTKTKREVLVFVTPHIITPELLASMQNQTADFGKREAAKEPSLIH